MQVVEHLEVIRLQGEPYLLIQAFVSFMEFSQQRGAWSTTNKRSSLVTNGVGTLWSFHIRVSF